MITANVLIRILSHRVRPSDNATQADATDHSGVGMVADWSFEFKRLATIA